MSLIYSLVAREQFVVVDYSAFDGNFPVVALDLLSKINYSKTYAQYAVGNYCFYTYVKEDMVFLVMVESSYETRIAIDFLKKIQARFFSLYNSKKRKQTGRQVEQNFKPILKELTGKYNKKAEVDKLTCLKQHLTDLENETLINLDKVLKRGEKIEVLVKKSDDLAKQSYDMYNGSRDVKNKMWWKGKKLMMAIGLVIVVVVAVVVIIAIL